MTQVSGFTDERFAAVRDALERRLDSGQELGASVAVAVNGEVVVDLWGGFTDPSKSTPWQADTLTNAWSTTKTVTALAALVLVDRGGLDVFEKVSHYWPEFAAAGKADIEVRARPRRVPSGVGQRDADDAGCGCRHIRQRHIRHRVIRRRFCTYTPNLLQFDLPMGSRSGAEYIRAAFEAVEHHA